MNRLHAQVREKTLYKVDVDKVMCHFNGIISYHYYCKWHEYLTLEALPWLHVIDPAGLASRLEESRT